MPGGGFVSAPCLPKAAYQATCALLRRPDPPSAVFAANDLIAFGVLAAARDNGVRVPAALSVIGFDDIREARFSNPPLTTFGDVEQSDVKNFYHPRAQKLCGYFRCPLSEEYFRSNLCPHMR